MYRSMQDVVSNFQKEGQGPLAALRGLGGRVAGGAGRMLGAPGVVPGALAGGAAGLGGAAAFGAFERPDAPPPPVVQMAEFIQRIRPELEWEDALDVAYEGWERFQEEKQGSDRQAERLTIEKQGQKLLAVLEDSKRVFEEHDKAKVAFALGFKRAFDKAGQGGGEWKAKVQQAMKETGVAKATGKEKAKRMQKALQVADPRHKAKSEKKASLLANFVDVLKRRQG